MLMAFKSQTQQQYCVQSSFNSCIVNCTLYIKTQCEGDLCVRHAKSTSNHPSVKMRRLIITPKFNQPKQQFSKYGGATCSFTYLHKTIVEIYPQETGNNGLVGLVLSLHHLSYHRHDYGALFSVTKEITRTRLNLSM